MADHFFSHFYRFTRWIRSKPRWISSLMGFGSAYVIAAAALIPIPTIRILVLIPLLTLSALFLVMFMIVEYADWRQRFILRQTDTLDRIRTLNWRDFESLVGAIYACSGYEWEPCGGDQPDGGIDHVLHKDGQRILVQCKHWRGEDIGIRTVRELYGVLMDDGAQAAILATSGGFTEQARVFAQGKPIELVDGPGLYQLIEELPDTLARETDLLKETLERLLARIVPEDDRAVPRCPKCHRPMVPRQNSQDQDWFWGCSRFPAEGCRGSRSLGPADRELIEALSRVKRREPTIET